MPNENQYLLPDEFIADERKPEEETTSTACKHDIQGSQYNFQTDDIHILEDISTTPPRLLLEEDENVSMTHKSPTHLFITLNNKRKSAAENLNAQECKIYEVYRHNCFNDLLSLYRDESIRKQNNS